ncbi:MAG TPA: crossover junction endodeoxyribonuclease RuvC, partial [Methylomirabilota bacterium]|nr:crossover junction endodeoxyribonuclease RuvC [Methylomirabilota bacterium]
MTIATRIIGIDPGLRRTGWGVIDTIGNSVRFVASGSVTSDGDEDLAHRLVDIHDGLVAVLEEFAPDEAA